MDANTSDSHFGTIFVGRRHLACDGIEFLGPLGITPMLYSSPHRRPCAVTVPCTFRTDGYHENLDAIQTMMRYRSRNLKCGQLPLFLLRQVGRHFPTTGSMYSGQGARHLKSEFRWTHSMQMVLIESPRLHTRFVWRVSKSMKRPVN